MLLRTFPFSKATSAVLSCVLLFGPFSRAIAQSPAQVAGGSAQQTARRDVRAAKNAKERAQRALSAGDWDQVLGAYNEAIALDPLNSEIRLQEQLVRFHLAQEHTEAASREMIAGRISAARQEVQQALRLDPGYFVARAMLQELGAQQFPSTEDRTNVGTGPVRINVTAGVRDFDYEGTTRGAFEEIARQFGLTA